MGLFNVIASAAVGAVSASALLLGLIRSGTIVIRSKHRRVVRTANPNPSYREGDKQPHPYGDSQRLLLNPSEMGADLYPFIISCVVPRPIAFISSLSKEVKPPRLAEAAVNLECKLKDSYEVKNRKGEITARIIIAEVQMIHVLEAVTQRTGTGKIVVDFEKYAPVSRLGGDTYARITETYDLPRPGREWQERRLESVPVPKS